MDADYGRNRDRHGGPFKTFEPSLFVWATVMSRPTEDGAIVDAGLKALAFDSGPPLVCDEPAATYERASDEHGRLAVSAATNRLGLGDKIRLIPGHCDPTVNLYDCYVSVRGNRVEQVWPITARGAVYWGRSCCQHRSSGSSEASAILGAFAAVLAAPVAVPFAGRSAGSDVLGIGVLAVPGNRTV
jgi:hypothetical protein